MRAIRLFLIVLFFFSHWALANPPPETEADFASYQDEKTKYKSPLIRENFGYSIATYGRETRPTDQELYSTIVDLGIEYPLDTKRNIHVTIDASPKTVQGERFSYGDMGYYFVQFRDGKKTRKFKLFNYGEEHQRLLKDFSFFSLGDYTKEFVTFSIREGNVLENTWVAEQYPAWSHYYIYDRIHNRVYEMGSFNSNNAIILSKTTYKRGILNFTAMEIPSVRKQTAKTLTKWVIDTNYKSRYTPDISWICYKPNKKPTDGNENCPLNEIVSYL